MADGDQVGGGVASCGSEPWVGSSAVDQVGSSNKKKSWIAIKLVDEDAKPVPGEEYRITVPDGSVVEGDLDNRGFACLRGIDPGTCQVTFPRLDKEVWHPK